MAFFRSTLSALIILSGSFLASAQGTAEKFGQLPETWDAQISPDGDFLALGCSPTGVNAVCLYEIDSSAKPRLILPPERGRLEDLYWASNDYLVYEVEVFDRVDTVNGLIDLNVRRMIAYDLKKSKSEMLLKNVGGLVDTTGVDSLLLNESDKILKTFSFQGGDLKVTGSRLGKGSTANQHIVYEVNLKSGKAKLKKSYRSGVFETVYDAEGNLYAQVQRDLKKKQFSLHGMTDGKKEVFTRDGVDRAPFYIAGIGSDGKSVAVQFDDGERFGLHTISLIDGSISPVTYEGKTLGNVATLNDPFTNEIIGYGYTNDLPGEIYFAEPFAKVAKDAQNALKSDSVSLVSWTKDRTQFTLASFNAGMPIQYYIYDIETPSISYAGGEAPWLEETPLGKVESVTYTARDGLEIPAYMTYPPNSDSNPGPYPLVMMPHGGPEARDTATYDWLAQSIAAEGYLVIQPNFRGSAGYGADFRNAGFGEFGGKMIEDVIDGAKWAANQGLGTPQYCSMGWSYGGYSALMTGLKDKEHARCLISINGVTNAIDVLKDYDNKSPIFAYWEQYLGDVFKLSKSDIRAISPDERASEYNQPILILHGREDTTVPLFQAQSLKNAINSNAAELVLFRGDDHQLARSETRMAVIHESVEFLKANHPEK
ncbi:MAG: prolyl oligopeptidase family serine peptidase [Henriciella sp.]